MTLVQNPHGRPRPLLLRVYRFAWRLVGPLLPAYLHSRAGRGKEDLTRLPERYGQASGARPDGQLVWVHAASVGESLSVLPLIERLLDQNTDLHILVTTGTVTSARLLAERLPGRAFHSYVPLDHPSWARRFVDHWQPDTVLWLESEFWPNLLEEISRRGIPAALLNARLSDRSFKYWKKRPGTIKTVLGGFSLCLAQDDGVAGKLKALGAPHVASPGNLKFAALPLPDAPADREALEDMIGARPLVLAAQTVPGEEAVLGTLLPDLARRFDGLLLIIVPRHPERGADIAAELGAQGLMVATRSRGDAITAGTDVYLADTMGELGLFFRLKAPVFLGRSLVSGYGGSNLLEPARFERCIIQGPHTENFSAMNALFRDASASLVARDEEQLKVLLGDLLSDADQAARLGRAAKEVSRSALSVLDRVHDAITPLLPASKITDDGGHDARP